MNEFLIKFYVGINLKILSEYQKYLQLNKYNFLIAVFSLKIITC